jgi:hypothetical protein
MDAAAKRTYCFVDIPCWYLTHCTHIAAWHDISLQNNSAAEIHPGIRFSKKPMLSVKGSNVWYFNVGFDAWPSPRTPPCDDTHELHYTTTSDMLAGSRLVLLQIAAAALLVRNSCTPGRTGVSATVKCHALL